jgi:rSAM/selenodomain-associated transferase 2
MSNPAPWAETPSPRVSLIVPTLNESHALGATLDVLLALPDVFEIIVVDGGSLDSTVAIACVRGVRQLWANRGRGSQLHAGAQAARGDILWFVHADTHPPADAARQIRDALARSGVSGGCFAVRFDSNSRPARFLTWFYSGLRRLGLSYGDATLFVRRTDYEDAGGFRSFPLFEDVDLVQRLRRRGRFVGLKAEVVASSRRFEGRNFAWTLAWWMVLQCLYWLGVPPHVLGRIYAPIRRPPRKRSRAPVATGNGFPDHSESAMGGPGTLMNENRVRVRSAKRDGMGALL